MASLAGHETNTVTDRTRLIEPFHNNRDYHNKQNKMTSVMTPVNWLYATKYSMYMTNNTHYTTQNYVSSFVFRA